MEARRHVVFVGAYGIQNAGDDAPLLVMTDGLRRRHPDVEFRFTVFSRHEDPLVESLSGARFLANPEYESREASRGRWLRGFNHGDDRSDLERIDETIRDADLVIAGAGNVMTDIAFDLFRGPIPLCATYAMIADLHRTPFMLYGITAGPIRSPRARTLSAWIARRSAVLTVRDEASASLLREIDPELRPLVHPDPVLALEPASDAEFRRALDREGLVRDASRRRLAIACRDLDFLGFEEEILIEAMRRLARDYDLLFVPQSTGIDCDDRDVARRIVEAIGGERDGVRVICDRHAPHVLMRFYELADATFACRLHGAVFSARAGVPVVGLAYLPKVSSFLARIGLEGTTLDVDDVSPDAIVEAVARARMIDGGAVQRRSMELAAGVASYLDRAGELMGLGPSGRTRSRSSERPVAPRTSWPTLP